MPYISQDKRKPYDEVLNQLEGKDFFNKGDLEYCIYKLMCIYMQNKEFRYSNLHDVVYSAMHCSHEFERRYLDLREDKARLENGEIS